MTEIDASFYRASANRMATRIAALQDYFIKIKAERALSDLELRAYWTLVEIMDTESKMLLTAVQNANPSLKN